MNKLIIVLFIIVIVIIVFNYLDINSIASPIQEDFKVNDKPNKLIIIKDKYIKVYDPSIYGKKNRILNPKLQFKDSTSNLPKMIPKGILKNKSINTPKPFDATPSSLDINDIEKSNNWDESFGIPLVDPAETKKNFVRAQQRFNKFNNGLGKFESFRDDRSNLIVPKTTIDPFKPDQRSNSLIGKSIKQIYDDMMQPPTAKPMKILNKTKTGVMYEDESVLNGGKLQGTGLVGWDGLNGAYQSADFTNGW